MLKPKMCVHLSGSEMTCQFIYKHKYILPEISPNLFIIQEILTHVTALNNNHTFFSYYCRYKLMDIIAMGTSMRLLLNCLQTHTKMVQYLVGYNVSRYHKSMAVIKMMLKR